MIGDGATDLEARQDGGADIFIGYVFILQQQQQQPKKNLPTNLIFYIYMNINLMPVLSCLTYFVLQVWGHRGARKGSRSSRLGCLGLQGAERGSVKGENRFAILYNYHH